MRKLLTILFISLFPLVASASDFPELLSNGDCTVTGSWQFAQGSSQTTVNTNEWYINENGQFQIDNPTTYNWLIQVVDSFSRGTFYNTKYTVVSNTNLDIAHKFSTTGFYGPQTVGDKAGGTDVDVTYVCTSENAWSKWGVGPGTGTIVVDNISLKEVSYDTPKAFPSASGYGSITRGAYSGSTMPTIYRPSNYTELKTAMEASGPRIIIPDQGGTYDSGSSTGDDILVKYPYMTFWGQNVSGGGLHITRATVLLETHDLIIRGLSSSVGLTEVEQSIDWRRRNLVIQDGRTPGERYNIILDHCDMFLGSDENVTLLTSKSGNDIYNITIQYCNISSSYDTPGDNHNFGMFVGSYGGSAKSYNISVHHNLIANHRDRFPLITMGPNDTNTITFYNNVLYNANWGFTYFVEHSETTTYIDADILNNYYQEGPDTQAWIDAYGWNWHINAILSKSSPFSSYSQVFLNGNVAYDSDGNSTPLLENLSSKSPNPLKSSIVTDTSVSTVSAQEAYNELLVSLNVGYNYPTMNSYAKNIVDGVKARTLEWVTSFTFPTIEAGTPTTDTDADGMPDSYEDSMGYNKNDATDAHTVSTNGYTYTEIYNNGLFSAVTDEEVPTDNPPPPPPPPPNRYVTFVDGKTQTFKNGNTVTFLGPTTALTGQQPPSTVTETVYTLISLDPDLDTPASWNYNGEITGGQWNVTQSAVNQYLQHIATINVTPNQQYVLSYNILENGLDSQELRLSNTGSFAFINDTSSYNFLDEYVTVGSHKVTVNCISDNPTSGYELRIFVDDDSPIGKVIKIGFMGVYSFDYEAIPTGGEYLGPEMMSNYTFESGGANWSGEFSYQDDSAVATANGTYFYLQQNASDMVATPTVGTTYKVIINVGTFTINGTYGMSSTGAFGSKSLSLSTGDNVFYWVCTADVSRPFRFFLRDDNTSGICDINYVSMKEVQ